MGQIFFRDFVPTTRTDVSVSGGTASTTYYLSAGYLKQEGSTAPSVDYHRYNLNTNVDTRINSWLKAGLSLSVGYSEREGGRSTTSGARVLALLCIALPIPMVLVRTLSEDLQDEPLDSITLSMRLKKILQLPMEPM
ncbi:hypothetical protein [Capnocytophaga granulosa]|uniref:hypothetical protein n=1 Tax=Capnocytophaga granulosa TaxID=45242 RepID=UPI001FD33DD4|nr:hypothetical protein [Capnocytophaga granulosa]